MLFEVKCYLRLNVIQRVKCYFEVTCYLRLNVISKLNVAACFWETSGKTGIAFQLLCSASFGCNSRLAPEWECATLALCKSCLAFMQAVLILSFRAGAGLRYASEPTGWRPSHGSSFFEEPWSLLFTGQCPAPPERSRWSLGPRGILLFFSFLES